MEVKRKNREGCLEKQLELKCRGEEEEEEEEEERE